MNKREKLILIAVATLIVVGALYGMLNSLLLAPRAQYLEAIATKTKALAKLKGREAQGLVNRRRLAALVDRTYTGSFDDSRATQHAMRQRLRALATESGLSERPLSLNAAKPGPVDKKGRYRQISWAVGIRGNLTQVTDFVYLLSRQPYLQRIENLKVRPDLVAGEVNVTFRYLTLALQPKGKATGSATRPTTQPTSRPAPMDLDTPDRHQYDAIASRDLFRPYIKRKPTPKPRDPAPRVDPPKPEGPRVAPSRDGFFRVVGLPNWSGNPRNATVLVTDTQRKNTVEHRLGASFGGGKIVWVDYRPMPDPAQPEITSSSRVIIKIKDRYWAIELGQTLAQKHAMTDAQLPEQLKSDPPATAAIPVTPPVATRVAVRPSPPPVARVDRGRSRRANPTARLAHLQMLARIRVSELIAATTGTLTVDER